MLVALATLGVIFSIGALVSGAYIEAAVLAVVLIGPLLVRRLHSPRVDRG